MDDYVSGTDLSTFFLGRLADKRLLKVTLPSKLSPRDEGAGTQVEKRKRNNKKGWKGQRDLWEWVRVGFRKIRCGARLNYQRMLVGGMGGAQAGHGVVTW